MNILITAGQVYGRLDDNKFVDNIEGHGFVAVLDPQTLEIVR